MESHFSDKLQSHGRALGPFDYPSFLNWTYFSARNISSGSLLELSADTSHSISSSLGVASATLITLLLSSRGALQKVKYVVHFQSMLYGVLIMVLLLLILPFFVILALYRGLVFCFLKMRSSTFISLMDGPDAVWNLKDTSQPIITVLLEVEAEEAEPLLKSIRETILKTILVNPQLTWRRMYSYMGFSYWEMCHDLSSLSKQVRWMPHTQQALKNFITLSELQLLISDTTHCGLAKDSTSWEILVSRQRLFSEKEESRKIYPVLFRIHHSLGDGVSLLQLLLNNLSTTCSYKFPKDELKEEIKQGEYLSKNDHIDLHNNLNEAITEEDITKIYNYKILQQNQARNKLSGRKSFDKTNYRRGVTEIFVSKGKIKFGSIESKSQHQFKTFLTSIKDSIISLTSITNNVRIMQILLYSLKEIRNTCEKSILNTENVSGKKLIAWYTDTPQGNVFSSIKKIKSQVKGVRFTDVILAALSRKIERYLGERKVRIPNCISVVVPVYTSSYMNDIKAKMMSETLNVRSENRRMKNSFSLGVLNLPVKTKGPTYISHLKKVAQHMNQMHKSGQYTINSFFLKWVANVLPDPLLNKFLQLISHNTMIVSNLVGPTDILYIAGFPLRNIYFWVPQRGKTGLSVSILSYCNRIQLGMMVDKTIIKSAEEVQHFLDEVASEVTKLME